MKFDPNKPVWQLTVGEFTELMESLKPKQVEPVVDEVYMNTDEVVKYLNVSRSTILRWRDDLYLPYEKKGGILRFKKSEVDKVLNKK